MNIKELIEYIARPNKENINNELVSYIEYIRKRTENLSDLQKIEAIVSLKMSIIKIIESELTDKNIKDISLNMLLLTEIVKQLPSYQQEEYKIWIYPIITKIVTELKKYDRNKSLEINNEFYPGPTEIERIQHVFGEIKPIMEYKKRYIGFEIHHIYKDVFKETTEIQLELPGLEKEDSLAKIDREIADNTDPLALKIFHAVLAECYKQHEDWGAYCYWDTNTFCDMLGYKRDKKGYHQTTNIKQVEKRLRILASLKYRFELIGYDQKTKADKIVFEGPLMRIEPDQTANLFRDNKRIAKKSTLRIHDELHKSMMKRKMFAWYDKAFLKLNPQQHNRAILLYVYYASQLAMGAKQRKDKHIVKRPIDTTLRETGIVISYKNKKRDRESFIEAHEELKSRGLIKDFVITWGKNETEIFFPIDHPTIRERSEKTAIKGNQKLVL